MPITRELKERWIARLESPEAKKAERVLMDVASGGMCCLGHLADIQGTLHKERGDVPKGMENPFSDYLARDSFGLTLPEMERLAELNDENDGFPIEEIRALPEVPSPTSSDALPATAGTSAGSEQPCPVASDPAVFSQKGGA